ncbi:MAG: glutamate ligase domain-containing protein, partial [Sphingopyxis sp.]
GRLRVLFGARQVDARLPALPGAHQFANSALAIAMLMAQDHVTLSTQALIEAPAGARWPARLQSMAPGPLTAPIADRIVTLDGGHNVNCAMALARHFHGGRRQALIMGMLANKDAAGWLRAMAGSIACVIPVPIDGHDHHPPATLAAMAEAMGIPAECARDLPHAVQIAAGTGDTPVLIAGSLYLAGTALRLNQQYPE